MIYVASPYSHPDPIIREGRYLTALRYTAFLHTKNLVAFSPIAYGHQFSTILSFDYGYETWQAFNDHMLKNSTEMHILALPEWEKSKGLMHEIAFATLHKIPTKTINLWEI